MKTIDDLSTFEIAHLTDAQLNNLVEVELMRQGIVIPPQPPGTHPV